METTVTKDVESIVPYNNVLGKAYHDIHQCKI